MAPPLIQLNDISLTFGGTPLLDGVELSVSSGERVCLVGRNGSGKSTLLKIAAGLIEPDRGTRFVQPDATIRYLPQEPDLSAHPTTLAYVQAGLGPGDDAHHDLARSRQDAADRARIRRVRSLARRSAGGGRTRSAQARPQDRGRAALASLWRDGAAQAQCPPPVAIAAIAADPARVPRGRRQGRHRCRAGGEI